MVKELRGLRDPNKQQVISDKPAITTEVVVRDRSQNCNSHASEGVWAEQEEELDKANALSCSTSDAFKLFIIRARRGEELTIDKDKPLCNDDSS